MSGEPDTRRPREDLALLRQFITVHVFDCVHSTPPQLTKQGVYPAVVSLHVSQRAQVSGHGSNHPRNSSHCFKENDPPINKQTNKQTT